MILEIYGHIKTNSLSLLADALHLLVDISGFLISIFTLKLSQKSPSNKYTFGYHRCEVIGALFSVLMIWIVAIYLICESIYRYKYPHVVQGGWFLIVATIGFLANVACAFLLLKDFDKKDSTEENIDIISHYDNEDKADKNCNNNTKNNIYQCKTTFDNFSFSSDFLRKHSTEKPNLNIKATYTHILGDILQSLGVIIASLIVYLKPGFVLAEIFCSFVFSILVLISTIPVCKEGFYILSEGTPSSVDIDKIKEDLLKHEKILRIQNINCWSVGVNHKAINIKILVDHIFMNEYEHMLKAINAYLKQENNIEIVTIEINTPNTDEENI